MGTILAGMATPQQFEDALAAVQKGPLPHAALERLTALQQGIRRRASVIVEICRASPVNGPQHRDAQIASIHPRPRAAASQWRALSSSATTRRGTLHHCGRAIGVIIVFRVAQRRRK